MRVVVGIDENLLFTGGVFSRWGQSNSVVNVKELNRVLIHNLMIYIQIILTLIPINLEIVTALKFCKIKFYFTHL